MTTMTDTCWADPLTRAERRQLAAKLARACRLAYASRSVVHRTGETALVISLTLLSADLSELHLDVTEHAAVPVPVRRRAGPHLPGGQQP